MDHPYRSLKYVGVRDLGRSKQVFDNFAVEDPMGEKLGKLEGFIVDTGRGLPYYSVVDTGGWFRSKHVLIPIGHAMLDSESHKLIADVPKERIRRFPGFDLNLFPTLSNAELNQMGRDIAMVCCADDVAGSATDVTEIEVWTHYRTPAWWDPAFSSEQRDEAGARSKR
jgi:hypothetical protein